MVAVQLNHFQFRTASLPGVAGMQFSLLKCVETHEITHIHTNNPKKSEIFHEKRDTYFL